MISSIPILWSLLLGAVVVSATSDGTVNQVGVVSNLRGSLGKSNDAITTKSLSNTPTTPRFMSIIEYHTSDVTEDSYTSVTLPLRVFLSDTPRLLDDVTRFEQAAVAFISDNTNAAFPSKDGVVRFTSAFVVEQVLTWEEDTSSIGLDVHFQVHGSVPNTINHNRLKKATQMLLNTRNDMFQVYLEDTSSRDIADNDEAESIALKNQSLRSTIGFMTAAVGLCGIIASFGYLYRKMKINQPSEREESKPKPTEIDSKPTLETSESFVDGNDSYLEDSVTFPMKYHEKQPEEWDDVSGPDGLSDDGSFNASVAFCPSVEQRGYELVIANIEENTDSERDEDDGSSPPLSPESLQEFDMAIRRAEF